MDPIDTDRSAQKAPPRRLPTKLPEEEDIEKCGASPSHFPDIYDDYEEEEKEMDFDENAKTDMVPPAVLELDSSQELQTVKPHSDENHRIIRDGSQTFVSRSSQAQIMELNELSKSSEDEQQLITERQKLMTERQKLLDSQRSPDKTVVVAGNTSMDDGQLTHSAHPDEIVADPHYQSQSHLNHTQHVLKSKRILGTKKKKKKVKKSAKKSMFQNNKEAAVTPREQQQTEQGKHVGSQSLATNGRKSENEEREGDETKRKQQEAEVFSFENENSMTMPIRGGGEQYELNADDEVSFEPTDMHQESETFTVTHGKNSRLQMYTQRIQEVDSNEIDCSPNNVLSSYHNSIAVPAPRYENASPDPIGFPGFQGFQGVIEG